MIIPVEAWCDATPPAEQVTYPRWLRQTMFGAMILFLASTYFSIALNSLSLGVMGLCFVTLMVLSRCTVISPTPLDYFFLAYAVAEILSTLFSVRFLQSLEFSKRLLLIGIVYFFATWITTERLARASMTVLLASAAVVSLIGLVKLVMAPQDNTRLGIFQFYMTTSELMMVACLLLLPFAVHPGTPRNVRWSAWAALVPVLIALYATVTRGAYLAAAAGMLFIGVMRNRKFLIPLAAALVLTILFAPPYVESRIRSIVDLGHPENASRLMLWKTGLRMAAAYPILGVGDIDLHEVYLRFMDPGDPALHGHMHNIAMQVLVTLGIVGFIAVTAMFVQIWRVEWHIYRRVKDEWFAGSAALGALAVFVGFQVSGLTEWTFGDQEVVVLFWVTVGMALAVARLRTAGQITQA